MSLSNSEFPSINRLAVKLSPAAQTQALKGHPWIFEKGIAKIGPDGKPGDICIVFDQRTNKVIGVGLLDPQSVIRIKMVHHGGPATIERPFFQQKLKKALAIRSPFNNSNVSAYRIIFGENDQFPGLILDKYDRVLVLKLYSSIWVPYLSTLLELFVEVLEPKAIVGRLGRKTAQAKDFDFEDGDILWGELSKPEVHFQEHGVNFKAHLIKGHKTGFFLDHRHNRKRVGELSENRTVLDVFSYAGGFTVHALAGGAREVTSLDISEQALGLAQENARLNPHKGQLKTIAGDAFKVMTQKIEAHERYDLVVVDPPSFAAQSTQVKLALKQYGRLAKLGSELTKEGGILVLASCSSRVSAQSFFDRCEHAFREISRPFKILETTYHDLDHPIGFPEGAYLKCRYYRL